MTHTSTEQPEARDLAYWIAHTTDNPTAALIQSLHARVQELEASQAQRVPLSDEQIEALHVWRNFVGMFPEARLEITRSIEAAHGITQEKQG